MAYKTRECQLENSKCQKKMALAAQFPMIPNLWKNTKKWYAWVAKDSDINRVGNVAPEVNTLQPWITQWRKNWTMNKKTGFLILALAPSNCIAIGNPLHLSVSSPLGRANIYYEFTMCQVLCEGFYIHFLTYAKEIWLSSFQLWMFKILLFSANFNPMPKYIKQWKEL